nr:unnamed protein product [Callosobruchus chinensis]
MQMQKFRGKRNKLPWITDVNKLMISLRNKARNKFKRHRKAQHFEYYRTLKNLTTNALRNEKKAYIKFCINNSKDNQKLLWNGLKSTSLNTTVNTDEIEFYKESRFTSFEAEFSFSPVPESVIYNCLQYSKSYTYADDTQVKYSFSFNNTHNDVVAETLKLTINGDVLPNVKVAKNLGLELDTNSRFSKHIDKLMKLETSYNFTKGGVDTLDELSANYNVSRNSRRWPLAFLYSLLNTAGVIHKSFSNKTTNLTNDLDLKVAAKWTDTDDLASAEWSLMKWLDVHYQGAGRSLLVKPGSTLIYVHDDAVKVNGYRIVRKDRQGRGGGVAMYVKENIRYEIFNAETLTFKILALSFKLNGLKFMAAVIYKPPGFGNMDSFFSEFDETVAMMHLKCDRLILTGDFNINMLKIDNTHVTSFLNILESYSLAQTVSEPTRVGLTSASLIDLIICSESLTVDSANVDSNVDIADHFWIDCYLIIYSKKTEPEIIYYRDLKRMNLDDFTEDLNKIPFQDIYYTQGIDNKLQLFNTFIIDLFDKLAPIRQVKLRKNSKPWVTDTLKMIQSIRDNYLRKFKRSRDNNSWQQYKEWRNYYNNSLIQEKKAYFSQKLLTGSSKDKWRTLNGLSNIFKSSKVSLPEHLCNPDEVSSYFHNILSHRSGIDCTDISTEEFHSRGAKNGSY